MKKSTAYSVILSLSLCALIGSAGFCSSAGPTTTYDVTVVEKQATLTVVSKVMNLEHNLWSYEFINPCLVEVDGGLAMLQPVKAKGFISAFSESYGKRYWLIPFKITPGSKLYEYLADLAKTQYIRSTGLIEKPVKIPISKC